MPHKNFPCQNSSHKMFPSNRIVDLSKFEMQIFNASTANPGFTGPVKKAGNQQK